MHYLIFICLLTSTLANFIELFTDNKIHIEIAENRCLSGIRPGKNEPYKYIVSTDCDFESSLNNLLFEKFEEQTLDGFDYFKIQMINDDRSEAAQCIGFEDGTAKALLEDCHGGNVQKFRQEILERDGQKSARLITYPERSRERCLMIESSEDPSLTTLPIKVKKCNDKLKFITEEGHPNQNNLVGDISGLPLYDASGKKLAYATTFEQDPNNGIKVVNFIYRSDGRFMKASTGSADRLDDPKSLCLSGKIRNKTKKHSLNNKVNDGEDGGKKKEFKEGRKRLGALSKKMYFVPCLNATRFYIDDNDVDDDQEIHPVKRLSADGGEPDINWVNCLSIVKVPKINRKTKEVKSTFRTIISPCQRSLGRHDKFSFLGNPNSDNYGN